MKTLKELQEFLGESLQEDNVRAERALRFCGDLVKLIDEHYNFFGQSRFWVGDKMMIVVRDKEYANGIYTTMYNGVGKPIEDTVGKSFWDLMNELVEWLPDFFEEIKERNQYAIEVFGKLDNLAKLGDPLDEEENEM